LPISRPEYWLQNSWSFLKTSSGNEDSGCRLIFITLDVPTDAANNSNLAPLEALIDRVSATAAPEAILVLMSQVPPGYCRRLASRLRSTLRLFYQVETLVFGDAVARAVNPERYMVGCADVASGLPEIYRHYLEAFNCPVLPMRFESAELCKIAINCFLVSSVTTSNTLAEICERIGADWSEIIPALRLDRRIGPSAYLNPGLGIAGGNLERDLVTVLRLAAENGSDARVVTAWQQNSAGWWGEGEFKAFIDGAEGFGDGERGVGGDLVGECLGTRHELGGGKDLVDEADAQAPAKVAAQARVAHLADAHEDAVPEHVIRSEGFPPFEGHAPAFFDGGPLAGVDFLADHLALALNGGEKPEDGQVVAGGAAQLRVQVFEGPDSQGGFPVSGGPCLKGGIGLAVPEDFGPEPEHLVGEAVLGGFEDVESRPRVGR